MKMCKNCMYPYHMVAHNPVAPCEDCVNYDKWVTMKPTRADKIRAMSDEDLAYIISMPYLNGAPWCKEHKTCPYINEDPVPCNKCALEWIKQEAD